VALRGNFSGPVCSTDLIKVSKDAASLSLHPKKNFALQCSTAQTDRPV